jgi:hypothetical protein
MADVEDLTRIYVRTATDRTRIDVSNAIDDQTHLDQEHRHDFIDWRMTYRIKRPIQDAVREGEIEP